MAHKGAPTKLLQLDPEPTAIELFALARAAKAAEKVRDHLEEGTAPAIDVTIRLHGMLQIGLSEIKERRVKPDLVNVLGLVLEVLSSNQRRNLEQRLDAMHENADSELWPEPAPEMRILAEKAIDRWSRLEERPQRGAVTGVIRVEVLSRPVVG